MNKNLKLKLNKKTLPLIGIIVLISFIFIAVLLSGNQNNGNRSGTPSNITNQISYQIDNVTFDLKNTPSIDQMITYTTSSIQKDFITNAAQKLDMKNINSDSSIDLIKYQDQLGNYITLFQDGLTVKISNESNPNLINFSKDNILEKLSNILNISLSDYDLISNDSGGGYTTYLYDMKIKSYRVITDLDNHLLRVTLDNNGKLREMSLQMPNISISINQKLLSIDDVKKNFLNMSKGVYPDFPLVSNSTDGVENIQNFQDFKGKVEINDVQLAYLWPSKEQNHIFPVYRFAAKFYFDTGLVTDGSIIIPAADTSTK